VAKGKQFSVDYLVKMPKERERGNYFFFFCYFSLPRPISRLAYFEVIVLWRED
jgi:hypothetical protein